MNRLNLKTSYKPVIEYYEALDKFKHLGIKHEGAVRSAFQTLLESCGKQFNWTLVPEYQKKRQGKRVSIDSASVDQYQVSTNKRSGITNDSNRENGNQYIVKLIKRIVTISLETTKIVKALSKI
jgi:hypothetical protein